jgi:HSP20 family protein
MLMRFDPFRDVDRVTQTVWGNGRRSWMPIDVYRRDGSYVVQLDLPGVDPATIDVTVEKNLLTIKAARTGQPAEGDQVVVAERPHGRFVRQLSLGQGLDGDRIEARYDQGVLTLSVPVSEQAKPRKVEVVSGSGQVEALDPETAAA